MAVIKSVSGGAPSISAIIKYVTQEEKTNDKLLSGVRCSVETVTADMLSTKHFYGKTSGRQYKHIVWSLSPDEVISAEGAHAVSLELVKKSELFKGFEVLIATHVDKDHIHSHIIVNSVSLADGHKYRHSKKQLNDLKRLSDDLCLEHGLKVITTKDHEVETTLDKPTSYDQYTYAVLSEAGKGHVDSWVFYIADHIQKAKESASSFDEFEEILLQEGIKVECRDNRKNIVFSIEDEDGNHRKIRGKTLSKYFDEDFSKEKLYGHFETKEEQSNDRLGEATEKLRSFDRKISSYNRLAYNDSGKKDRKRERTREKNHVR
ncbi:MAG: relaxase/mobilization nuclease domain-containing protein [Spirochaetales bacterium]|nr:relaxase/mobilization nuclease domain-containing protein [Spirochaetales bacterium]